jgi:ATP-dependent RNA helicase DHX8/PRP22
MRQPLADAVLNRPWEDPLPEAGERHLAQELRGVGLTTYEQPEWKTAALGKATTYGMSDARSMKDQRESLPIYKLKDQLVQAVNDNQVRAVGAA